MLCQEEELWQYHCLIGPSKGYPVWNSVHKLQRIIGRYIDSSEWEIDEFIPLEDGGQLASVVCKSADVCEQLKQIRRLNVVYQQQEPNKTNSNFDNESVVHREATLLQLNTDCLRRIIELGTLKDQITWAKVSHILFEIVDDIWRNRFQTFRFDLNALKFQECLTCYEVTDLCRIAGRHVRTLIFNSVFTFPLIQKYLCNSTRRGNLMQKAKWFFNVQFCERLPHFPNVEVFKVQGKFLADFTLREVARYCRKLHCFQLLDPDTRCLRGTALNQFDKLLDVNIQDCHNISSRHFLQLCRRNKLNHLRIVDCLKVYNATYFMQHLCPLLIHLSVLHMSAIAHGGMVLAILNLPQLEEVRFSWINDFPLFENVYLEMLRNHDHRRATLSSIQFQADRYLLDNASFEQLSAKNVAVLRERVSYNAMDWKMVPKLWQTLPYLTALYEIHCDYCRPFRENDLYAITEMCPKLRLISLNGCRQLDDLELQERWQESPNSENCILQINGLISAEELEESIRKRPRNFSTPVNRSITLRFHIQRTTMKLMD